MTTHPNDLDGQITDIETLTSLYGEPVSRALVKELDHISDQYRAFIEVAPFFTVSTVGEEGLDCSPRGDPPGTVRIHDNKTILFPDRKGNNRLDTLRNLVSDPRISLLFLIPGVGETMRVNGRAKVMTDDDLCASFDMDGRRPQSVIVVTVDRIYFQCQKAIRRSRLWDPDAQVDRTTLPSTGEMLEAMSDEPFDGAAYEANTEKRIADTLY